MASNALLDGLEIAATVICPHCYAGYYAPRAMNDLRSDGNWLHDDIRTATHMVAGKRRVCRARKLIPLMLIAASKTLLVKPLPRTAAIDAARTAIPPKESTEENR